MNEISIIIPIHNAERFLTLCLSSIQAIQNVDFEVICIDDGSNDSSVQILDNAAKENARFKVFHIKNEGVSHARNKAISLSTKRNITFVDADDWIDSEKFTCALEAFEKCNVNLAYTPFSRVSSKGVKLETIEFTSNKILNEHEKNELLLKRLAPGIRFMGGVWRTFYKKDLIKSILFDTDLSFHEDVLFNLNALQAAKTVAILDTAFYFYRENEFSATFDKQINSLEQRSLFLQKMIEWAKNNALNIDFAVMRRRCPLYAREFAKAAKTLKGRSKREAIKQIHRNISKQEIALWKTAYFGKSFAPYVLMRRYGFDTLALFFLYFRFVF